MDKIRILVVDDESRMRKLVRDFLVREGYEVLEAGDGEEALDLFYREKDIALIILDVMMPKRNGFEVCREIRETSKVPIIMLTAKGEESDELNGFELGVDEYISKPFSPKILVARVGAILRRSGKTQDEEAAEAHKESASSSFIVKNALTYIEENYTKKLTLCEVAEKTYVSQWHLSKLLNRYTGQSFSDILNHVRIEHAKELLKDPSLRIGDISEQVGFLDLAHFSRVFKKQEGVSANEYRNQVLGK